LVEPACTLAVVGETVTEITGAAVIVTVVESDFVLSACEIALTVTVPLGTAAGAVYKPAALIVPTVPLPPVVPLTCQVTAVFAVFVSVAVNCCVKLTCTEGVFGLTATVIAGGAVTLTVAAPVFVASACEVAVTVTVPPVGTLVGAVYKPDALMVPMLAAPADVLLTCHVTAVFVVPVTVAANCCVWLVCTLAVAGATWTEIGATSLLVRPVHPARAAATKGTNRICRIAGKRRTAGLYSFTDDSSTSHPNFSGTRRKTEGG